jgi:hypothetical protein
MPRKLETKTNRSCHPAVTAVRSHHHQHFPRAPKPWRVGPDSKGRTPSRNPIHRGGFRGIKRTSGHAIRANDYFKYIGQGLTQIHSPLTVHSVLFTSWRTLQGR